MNEFERLNVSTIFPLCQISSRLLHVNNIIIKGETDPDADLAHFDGASLEEELRADYFTKMERGGPLESNRINAINNAIPEDSRLLLETDYKLSAIVDSLQKLPSFKQAKTAFFEEKPKDDKSQRKTTEDELGLDTQQFSTKPQMK